MTSLAHARGGPKRIALQDIGLLPLLFLLPFLYAPKILEGDTQPWVLIGAILAFFTYRPRDFLAREDLGIVLLALLSLAAFLLRAPVGPEMLRSANMFLTFAVLWIIFNRGENDLLRAGVRYSLVVWFVVAAYQYGAVALGLPVEFAGRYVEGRSGIPGLGAEPSYLGSISVIMAMYLLHDRKPGDLVFIAMAALNVLMSGSILGAMFLLFPLLYLSFRYIVLIGFLIFLAVVSDFAFNEGASFSRFEVFQSATEGLISLLIDPSINIRFGQIHFTLWESISGYTFFQKPLDFMNQYNDFSAQTGIYIPTTSNFIMPSAGEVIYQGGVFGLLLLAGILHRTWQMGDAFGERLLRLSFVGFCLLNPVSIANPFFILYVLAPGASRRAS